MSGITTAQRFSPEVRERAVRLVLEHQGGSASPWAAMVSVAAKVDDTAATLQKCVREAEFDSRSRR